MEHIIDPRTKNVFWEYPTLVQERLAALRTLIIQTAKEAEVVNLMETLKWGELSFIAKGGSTIRIDWKPKRPDSYSMYFICSTHLVETFKMVFGNKLEYEGKRALHFSLDEELNQEPVKTCIQIALTYHKVKNLPMLGL